MPTPGSPEGGATNSRPSPVFGTAAGVDTARWRFREGHDAYLRIRQRPDGCYEGARGELWFKDGPARVGVYPDGLVTVEGRAAAILAGDVHDHSLLEPGRLLLAEQAAASRIGHATSSTPTLGRVDLAGELRFGSGDEGLAFLHALASVNAPWCKVGVEGRKGAAIETVYGRSVNGKTILWRAYDKGVESETARPGERVRWERQLRFRKVREQSTAQFIEGDLRKAFVGRLDALTRLNEVVVCDVVEAIRRLGELDLSWSKRNRLTGFLVWGNAADRRTSWWYQQRAELQELGIAVDPAQAGRLVVPVGNHLRVLMSMWEAA